MTDDYDEILDGIFHGCALAAFLDQAKAEQGWPSSEATRVRAYAYYEQALAEKNRRKSAAALDPPGRLVSYDTETGDGGSR